MSADTRAWTFGDGGFVKVYGNRLAQSSLVDCDLATRWVFFWMLSQGDAAGRYRCATVAGLARHANVTLEQAEKAIADLEAPDPESTSTEQEGRRIVKIGGGWLVVNAEKYRSFRTERQEREAAKKRRQREGGHVPGRPRDGTPDVRRETSETNNNMRPSAAPSPTSKRSKRNARAETPEHIARFDQVFRRATGRRASLSPGHYGTFAARLAAGHPAPFLVGLPVGWIATQAPDAERLRSVRPDFLLRDGSKSYRRGDETRPTFDWLGSIWGALDRVRLTREQAAILADAGVLEWWRSKGAAPAREAETW